MSETVLKIRIGELTTVRLICQNPACGSVSEILLNKPVTPKECGMCHQPFFDLNRPGVNPLAGVIDALRQFEQQKPPVGIEFVIQQPDKG